MTLWVVTAARSMGRNARNALTFSSRTALASKREGGSIEEEVYVRNVVDQVDTNGMVLLGLSAGCARRYAAIYHPLLARGIYLAPSGFEVGFISAAHGSGDIDELGAALTALCATLQS